MKCPGCRTELSKRESEEGCPLCDWEPKRAARLAERRVARQEVQETSDVWQSIMADPRYAFATRLALYLVEQYDDEVKWKNNPVIWRNRQGSFHTKDMRDDKHYITFGYQSVDLTYRDGMREYKTWRWIWPNGLRKGLEGVYQEVVHEFAHALQSERNGRRHGQAHTMVWAQAVKEIQILVPFADVEELAR